MPSLHLYSHLKQLYISNKTERFSYLGGRGYMDVRLSIHLKEQLAWPKDKLLVINFVTRLRKADFHAYNSKTHFSPSNDSYTYDTCTAQRQLNTCR